MHIMIQQQILWFQIPVYYHMSMTIINTRNNLLKEPPGFMLLKFTIIDNVFKQFSTWHILHDHEDVSGCTDDLVEFNNVRMSKQFQILYFATNFANDIKTLDALTVEDFHRDFVLCELMLADFYLAECAYTKGFTQGVVADLHQRLDVLTLWLLHFMLLIRFGFVWMQLPDTYVIYAEQTAIDAHWRRWVDVDDVEVL